MIKSSWPAKIFLPSLSFSFSCQHSTFLASSISALPPRTFFPQICHRSLPRKEKSAGRICLHDVVHWHRPHFPQNISVIIAIIRFSLLSMQHFSRPILLESSIYHEALVDLSKIRLNSSILFFASCNEKDRKFVGPLHDSSFTLPCIITCLKITCETRHSCLGSPPRKCLQVQRGIAQIAIAPPPFRQPGTLGHFIFGPN